MKLPPRTSHLPHADSGGKLAPHLSDRIGEVLAGDEREPRERARLVDLMARLCSLPPPPDPLGMFVDYGRLRARVLEAVEGHDPGELEDRFAELYCHLHGYEAPYTPAERSLMNAAGGYWCHAGGLSPILKAGDYIEPATVSADYGAGNGLQGLLLQWLYPHARTIQIELSSRMVACGRALQQWLGIPSDRVEWRVADVRDVPPNAMSFVYLYRPLRPTGAGADFYRKLAADLARSTGRLVVFSVADCLGPLLPPEFERRYCDGHLRCFERPGGAPPRPAARREPACESPVDDVGIPP